MSSEQHTPGQKLSQASVRREVSIALRPLHEALHAPVENPVVPTASLHGFTFTGCRLWKSPGQRGYAWHANYTGKNAEGVRINGGIGDVAEVLYRHLRRAAIAKATGSAA